MEEKKFSIRSELKEGWELTKVNIGFLVAYQLLLYILTALFGSIQEGWKMAPWHLAGWIIVILGKMGLYHSILLMTKGIKPGFDEFYINWRLFLSWVVANILFGAAFVIGLILFIFPGCYLLATYGLFPFFIMDKKLGPFEAFKQAEQATEGIRLQIFLIFLACFGLNLLGLLFFGVGLLITIPVSLFALATVYRMLTNQTKTSIQPEDIHV